MSSVAKSAVTNPVQLYRHLLRCVKKLPPKSQPYYHNHVRQGFRSHADEIYPERIQEIINRAMEDAQWVLKKYCK